MKIVIAGAGRVGVQLARQLIEERHDVVLIDRNEEAVRTLSSTLDCMVLHGKANSRAALQKAGIHGSDYFIAVTESDEVNMIACGLVANEYEVGAKVARVRNFDYSDSKLSENSFLGIDMVINPEVEAAEAIVRSVETGTVSDVLRFERTEFEMRPIVVDANSPFLGRTVEETKESIERNFIIPLILRDAGHVIPSGNTYITEGDTVFMMAAPEDLDSIFESAGKSKERIRKILIVGGGGIGAYVAKRLTEAGSRPGFFKRLFAPLANASKKDIVLIEQDYAKCKRLAEEIPGAMVIHWDISEEGMFEQYGFTDYDLIIAATGNQELNLVTTMYAKSLGVKRGLALVRNIDYLHRGGLLNVDVTVSLNNTMVSSLMRMIRKGSIQQIHPISGRKVEILQLSVEEGSGALGKKLRDLRLPDEALVIFTIRDGENVLPFGDYEFVAGDNVVLICTKDSLQRVGEVFAVRPA